MTKPIDFRGVRYTIPELAQITGVSAGTIRTRLRHGWLVDQALLTPTPKQRRRGVVSNLEAFGGTGAGGTASEFPEIDFCKKAENP